MNTQWKFYIAGLVAMSFVGCAAPRVLLKNTIVGGRSVKYIMQKTGNEVTTNSAGETQTGQGMYDYSILVCDFNDQGAESNCGDTLLLRNITLAP